MIKLNKKYNILTKWKYHLDVTDGEEEVARKFKERLQNRKTMRNKEWKYKKHH